MTATDVEELLKVKAAFSLGLRRLLDAAAVPTQKLVYVYLAGALGEYADKQALENLGFFPRGMASRLLAKGNTSLEGAELLLRSPQSRASLKRWASSVVSLELAADEEFVRSFPEHMRFAW